MPTARSRLRMPAWLGLGLVVVAGPLLPGRTGTAAPRTARVVVVGEPQDGGRLEAARRGATLAVLALGAEAERVEVRVVDAVGGVDASDALRRLRREDPLGIVALPSARDAGDGEALLRRARAPVFFVGGWPVPDAGRNGDLGFHLAPSPAAQALFAADALCAPLAARRVAVVLEDSPLGHALAAGLARNLSRHIALAGLETWDGPTTLARLEGLEADWIYVALTGRHAVAFVDALATAGPDARLLFADGNRAESLLARGPAALEGAVFLGGPDPELTGRAGEGLVDGHARRDWPLDEVGVRAYEATRRLLAAWKKAGDEKPAKVAAAVRSGDEGAHGVLGPLVFEPHGGVRLFPSTLWVARDGRFLPWGAAVPTAGCGPPLGFGRPPPAEIEEKRGRLAFLTWGEGEERTIEQDLAALGLSTGGVEPRIDEAVRQEVLGRAIRVANRLFRREADGAAIPGWSWSIAFTTSPPPDDLARSRLWTARIAGDHPAAGGQVIGSQAVAVYSTFLQRTMYVQRRLEPPLCTADLPLFDGTARWGGDRSLDFRSEKIRCLLDGLASAVGLTLSHEFGHLCGCGHDTEHPTSIMNVVAGAGASWEDAVWIPSHQKSVSATLGLDGGR